MATLPFKASVYNRVVPGVPLRFAPGYVLVAFPRRIHPISSDKFWTPYLLGRVRTIVLFQGCRFALPRAMCLLPFQGASILCPYDN